MAFLIKTDNRKTENYTPPCRRTSRIDFENPLRP